MLEEDKYEKVAFIFKYRSELPLEGRKNLLRKNSYEQIANWPDDVLCEYYYYLRERVAFLKKIALSEEEKEEASEINDEYLLGLASIEENEDDFLGPKIENSRELTLKRIKKGL